MSSNGQIIETVVCVRYVDENDKWIAGCGTGWTQPKGSRTRCYCGRKLKVIDAHVEIPLSDVLPDVLLGVPDVE